MCDRSKVVIPGLLRSMNKLQATIDMLKEENRRLENMQQEKKGVGKCDNVINFTWAVMVVLFLAVVLMMM